MCLVCVDARRTRVRVCKHVPSCITKWVYRHVCICAWHMGADMCTGMCVDRCTVACKKTCVHPHHTDEERQRHKHSCANTTLAPTLLWRQHYLVPSTTLVPTLLGSKHYFGANTTWLPALFWCQHYLVPSTILVPTLLWRQH